MPLPVDLTNFREITNGDKEMESELFKEFINTADQYMETLKVSLEPTKSEEWRTVSHAFKGISLNLGATKLGELCKKAQESKEASAQDKTLMLDAVKREYIDVRNYLNSLL